LTVAQWYGWAKIARKWERLTGPHEGLTAASRALDDEVRRRGLVVPSRNQALTTGALPPSTAKPERRRGKRPRPQRWEDLG
jgi:hypothetical protein